ncbi:helix-turn-helix domain-containing protein [Streptomyces sp. NPDC002467]|uniref:helix-turn-helix domain-containing protein n=1 Tax=Streptomyces sp. NPDC002467 TaxID=3364647 RepID=UPI0036996E9C
MGRREEPVGADGVARTLALWLRRQRERAGISYRELAIRTKYSEDTLRRAASGKVVPTRGVVRMFADACGADPREAERLRRNAHVGNRRRKINEPLGRLLNIEYVDTFHELRRCLIGAYERAGSPSYRELASNPDAYGPLSRSTLSRFFWNKSKPSREFTLAFARGCGQVDVEAWARAWERCAVGAHDQREIRTRRVRKSSLVNTASQDTLIRCEGCYRNVVITTGSPVKADSQFWCSSCFALRISKFKTRTDDIKLWKTGEQFFFEIMHRCAES